MKTLYFWAKAFCPYFLLLTFHFLLSCTAIPGTPGHISEHTSKFDNTRQLSMEPAWCGGAFKLALFKTSTMPDSLLILTAVVNDIYRFAPGPSLEIRIGQQFYRLDGLDEETEHRIEEGTYQYIYTPPTAWSSQRYAISTGLLQEMINGNEVWVKINLEKEYLEGKFSTGGLTDARPAFKNFYEKIQEW